MFLNREMSYVNVKAGSNIPYPGKTYGKEALEELKNALYLYEQYYKGKIYDISFSNGENVEFEINTANVAHVLGVQYRYLLENEFVSNLVKEFTPEGNYNSYNLLNLMVENPDEVIDLDNEMRNVINFYRLRIRAEIFSKFSNFSEFNFGCITYDSVKAEELGYPTYMKSNHFLYVASADPSYPYYMMGINHSEGDNNYVETMFANEFPEKMFEGQSISTPTIISTTTSSNYDKKFATAEQKLRLSTDTLKIAEKYGANYDFKNDYLETLLTLTREEERKKIYRKKL